MRREIYTHLGDKGGFKVKHATGHTKEKKTNKQKELKHGKDFISVTAGDWHISMMDISKHLGGLHTQGAVNRLHTQDGQIACVVVENLDAFVLKRKLVQHCFLQAFHFKSSTKKCCGCRGTIEKLSPRLVRQCCDIEVRKRDENTGHALPSRQYTGPIEHARKIDYIACHLTDNCIKKMVENPKAGGVIRQVVITKDTKQWMELPRFFQ